MNDQPPPQNPPRTFFRQTDHLHEVAVMQSIIASMGDGVMVIDRLGEIVLANPALTDILGFSTQEITSRGWAELFFEEPFNQEFNQVIIDVIQERICHYNRQVEYVSPDGRKHELIVTTTLLTSDGEGQEVNGVLVVFKDISELSQLHRRERQLLSQSRALYQERVESLDRLARAVAHEIRNPVMSIGGLTQRLLGLKDPESKDYQYLRRILSSTERLERMVSEVRSYVDLPVPRLMPTDLGPWLARLVDSYRPRAREQGVSVELKLPEEGRTLECRLDPGLMGRAVRALLDNALDAMPDGGRLGVSLAGDEEVVRLTVSDSGRGIEPDDQPYLFDPFFTTKADAVGMSLAIAKRIAQDHVGDLVCQSLEGQGTTFTLTIPHRPPQAPSEQHHRPPSLK